LVHKNVKETFCCNRGVAQPGSTFGLRLDRQIQFVSISFSNKLHQYSVSKLFKINSRYNKNRPGS